MYQTTKNQLGWSNGGTPEFFILDGKRISAPIKLANIQVEAFKMKVENILNKIPVSQNDPLRLLKMSLQRWGDRADRREKFNLAKITTTQTLELLKNLGKLKLLVMMKLMRNQLK